MPYLGGIVIIRWHKLVEDQFQTVWNLQLSVPPVCVYINELAKILTSCRCTGQLRWIGESVCPPAFAPSRWQSGSPAHQPTQEQSRFFKFKSQILTSFSRRGLVVWGTQEPNLSGNSRIRSSLILSFIGPKIITGLEQNCNNNIYLQTQIIEF